MKKNNKNWKNLAARFRKQENKIYNNELQMYMFRTYILLYVFVVSLYCAVLLHLLRNCIQY